MISILWDIDSGGLRWSARRSYRILWFFVIGCVNSSCLNQANLRAQQPGADTPSAEVLPERRSGMDRFDMRAAEDAGRTEKLSLVRKSFERQRWDEGVQHLQSLLNEEHDSLIFGEDHVWRPVSEEVQNLFHRFPGDAQRAYDVRFGVLAERDLRQARVARDLAALSLVSRRYLLTPAGQLACRDLIDAAIDHGNGDAIAMQVRDLLRVDSPQLRDVAWRGQLVEVLSARGYDRLVKQLTEFTDSIPSKNPNIDSWAIPSFREPPALLRDWTSLSGSSTGHATTRTEESTLLPRWRHALVSSPRVRRLLEEQSLRFEDEGVLGLTVLSTVGSGEILVTRTLSNLTAVNVSTGNVLWTSREWGRKSLENHADSEELQRQVEINLEREAEGTLDYRIRKRMTSSSSQGTLSANSKYVFALASFDADETPLESIVQSGFEESNLHPTYLYARDLKTGKIAWRAGGPVSEEPPGLPAAGVFFFGPPTPEGDELFGVGERDGDILLFCMEAETGLVRWEQLLAAAGRRLSEDLVRRSWTAPVAVRGSIVVCPTTTGWLTAVDRISRRLLWSTRLVQRAPARPDSTESDLAIDTPNREGSLDERWPPLQPILLRDRVIVAPIELPDETGGAMPKLMCFDLSNGASLWEIPKNQFVGVVGASEELVYLFDRFSVQAFHNETGLPAWTCSVNDAIAGRPLLTQSGIVIPTKMGSLIRINPIQGDILERTQFSSKSVQDSMLDRWLSADDRREMSLGNLLSLGGHLISVSPTEMVVFEWKVDEARWQAEARTNAESAIRWARSIALRGQFAEAAQALRDSASLAASDASLLSRHRQTLTSVLLLQSEEERQRPDPDRAWHAWLHEAKTPETSPEDLEAIQRLEIQLAIQSGEWEPAWTHIRHAIRHPLRFSIDIDHRVVSPDVWLADCILSLGQIPDRAACDAMRESIRAEFQSLWKESGVDRRSRERLLHLFAETPFADQNEMDALEGGTDPLTLTKLLALSLSRDRTVALRASVRVVELLATPDWVGEARRRLARLPADENWPKEIRPSRLELEQALDGIVDIHRQPPASWWGAKVEVVRQAEPIPILEADLPLLMIGEPCEALNQFSYVFDSNLETVVIERADGSRYGELPFASKGEIRGPQMAPVLYGSGLNIYVIYGGVIHAFSIPGKRLLWQRTGSQVLNHDARWYARDHIRGRLRNPPSLREAPSNLLETFLETANSRHLVVRSRRGIEVLCALTGLVQWAIPRCPEETVRSDEDRLYRLSGNHVSAYSIRSGRSLLAPGMSELNETLSGLNPTGIMTFVELPGDGLTWELAGHRVRAESIVGRVESDQARWDEQDLLKLETVWTLPVKVDSRLGMGPPGLGVLLDGNDELKLIDWATGQTQSLGQAELASENNSEIDRAELRVNVRWDRFQVYVLTDSSIDDKSLDFPAIPVKGTISVHSRNRSVPEWNRALEGYLLTSSFQRFPCLAFLHLEELQVAGYPYQNVHLTLLDKQSGNIVYQLNTKSFSTGVSGSQFDPKSQQWDLSLQSESLRVQRKSVSLP